MKLLLSAFALVLFGACTVTSYSDGQHKFHRTSFGMNTAAQKLQVTLDKSGAPTSLTLDGYNGQQSPEVAKVAQAAATGAMNAVLTAAKVAP